MLRFLIGLILLPLALFGALLSLQLVLTVFDRLSL